MNSLELEFRHYSLDGRDVHRISVRGDNLPRGSLHIEHTGYLGPLQLASMFHALAIELQKIER